MWSAQVKLIGVFSNEIVGNLEQIGARLLEPRGSFRVAFQELWATSACLYGPQQCFGSSIWSSPNKVLLFFPSVFYLIRNPSHLLHKGQEDRSAILHNEWYSESGFTTIEMQCSLLNGQEIVVQYHTGTLGVQGHYLLLFPQSKNAPVIDSKITQTT